MYADWLEVFVYSVCEKKNIECVACTCTYVSTWNLRATRGIYACPYPKVSFISNRC